MELDLHRQSVVFVCRQSDIDIKDTITNSGKIVFYLNAAGSSGDPSFVDSAAKPHLIIYVLKSLAAGLVIFFTSLCFHHVFF